MLYWIFKVEYLEQDPGAMTKSAVKRTFFGPSGYKIMKDRIKIFTGEDGNWEIFPINDIKKASFIANEDPVDMGYIFGDLINTLKDKIVSIPDFEKGELGISQLPADIEPEEISADKIKEFIKKYNKEN